MSLMSQMGRINADPRSFVCTADPRYALAAVKRGKQALEFHLLTARSRFA